ncbi:hypothetical protein A4S02_05855 [Acetobacter ascendens]|uniref:Uncharacterized protein n=1 Tax=Acetobacter ascendens TaxID=481146 RepID=A0A1D8QVL0_9PROT|nr:hypothetical protein A4S02_05855 [Acetobacter ascendens]
MILPLQMQEQRGEKLWRTLPKMRLMTLYYLRPMLTVKLLKIGYIALLKLLHSTQLKLFLGKPYFYRLNMQKFL